MPELSLVIISGNGRDLLKQCIKSVPFADEIIVLSSTSSDHMEETAASLGAKVFYRNFDDYGNQKRAAISYATGTWILSLDNDECLSPELAEEIQKTLQANPPENGFMLRYRNYFAGKPLSCLDEQYEQLRLFRRNTGNYTDSSVHEHIVVNGPVKSLKNPVIHYSYRSVSQILKKFEIYTEKEAVIRKNEGRRFRFRQLLYYPAAIFWRRHIRRKGYRDGLHGLILTLLFMWYQFMIYVKLWEMEQKS